MSAKLSNIKRQLLDIVNEGQKFKNIDNVTEEKVHQFNNYSMELKSFLKSYSQSDMIKERVEKIKEVIYKDDEQRLWVRAMFIVIMAPAIFMAIKDLYKKRKCQTDILEIISLYSSIEFLLRNYEE